MDLATTKLRSDEMVALLRGHAKRIDDPVLTSFAEEFSRYHIELRNSALKMEQFIHDYIKSPIPTEAQIWIP